jgi:hypothetical protein
MGKIFRLHSGTTENIEHWQKIPSYIDHNTIDTIQDPAGLTASTQITSIPSPFARFDLVKSAFLYLVSNKKIDGDTIYHRMVSEALDVAELFFNIEVFKDKIEIIEWRSGINLDGENIKINEDSDLGLILKSSNTKHKLLGETLKMFLTQDKQSFNFSRLKNIYLLNDKTGHHGRLNIIGGTSPTTMFFSTSNDLTSLNLKLGNHKLFGSVYCPLYKRSPEFIRWLYTIQQIFPSYSQVFKGINDYLDQNLLHLNNDLRLQINEINSSNGQDKYNSTFKEIQVKSAGHIAELLGFTLRCKNYEVDTENFENDFIVNATKQLSGKAPCVLPIEAFNLELNYAGAKWQPDWYKSVPKFDNTPLQNRSLPNNHHIKYPYLTICDLLESYIIKVPYPLDNNRFFDGNYETRGKDLDHGYILPIKRELFNYFNIQDLKGVLPNGRKMIEIKEIAGGVAVVLRIPIQKGNFIEYKKIYINNTSVDTLQKPDDEHNIGVIVENQFTLAIYPFVNFSENINPHYRVLLVDRDVNALTKHFNYSLSFFKNRLPETELTRVKKKIRSDKNQSVGVSTNYYIVEENYDFIEIKHNYCSGIIIPNFVKPDFAHKKYKFAIDFGTTNTHIEVKEGEVTKPFEITEKDIQIGTLYSSLPKTRDALTKSYLGFGALKLTSIVLEEFFPENIGGSNNNYRFPQRTVINDNGIFNEDEANYALADFNIPFWYLKWQPINSNITPNLKWLEFKTDRKAERRTRAFLKQIMMMLRNKVILNGGELKETEVVWFYPSSMPAHRKNKLELAWKEFYKRYFGDHSKLYKVSESFAPFYYYYNNQGVRPNTRPGVNIDIGGGTTDIVIYSGQNAVCLTSFRFASSSIFGDGYGNTKKDNGFVLKYEPIIKQILSNTTAHNLISIYDGIDEKTKSSIELCEFFFSLQENNLIKEKSIKLSFSDLLSNDDELKIVFVFYYSALIYHLAKLMMSKGLQIPEFITFSGNGAKLISITSGSDNLLNLEKITKAIFYKVYLPGDDLNIKLKLVENPKEVTCKGGLEIDDFASFESLEEKIFDVLIGDKENNSYQKNSLKYLDLQNTHLQTSLVSEVSEFVDLFFELNETVNFKNTFGINMSRKDELLKLLKENIHNDLISGINEKLKEVLGNETDKIEESLFFYPLKGAINRLAAKIYYDNK